jgi:hypothetical protein
MLAFYINLLCILVSDTQSLEQQYCIKVDLLPIKISCIFYKVQKYIYYKTVLLRWLGAVA